MPTYKHHLSLVALFILSISFGVTVGYEDGRVSFPSDAGAADCSTLSTLGACQAQVQCTVVYDFDCTALADQTSCDANVGNGCSSVIHDCSQHDDNEPACTAAVCMFNANDCTLWNGDEGTCVANGCSYDGDLAVCSGTATSGSCTGDYFEACDGTDGTGFAGCTGTYSLCGDGVPDVGEACDDGNATNDDYCTNACANNGSCGDGVRQAGAEACDDGNATNDDYCTNACANNGSCGDGARQPGAEACDDGNTSDGDYCNSSCTANTGSCGDSVTQSNEACDDGNATNDDYCTNACANNGSCGDGVRQAGAEACDDGNATNGDGCNASCTVVETGYSCNVNQPNVCSTTCGDGVRAGAEACDDGDASSGDGCSASCTVETGYSCDNASPNACATTCGDGVMAGAEACDDGNATNGDGCSASCAVEAGWSCDNDPLPSTCQEVFDCGGEPCQGFLSYGGHDYYRFDTSVSWSDAQASCESVDAYLVTITDADEQAEMRDFTSGLGQFWIGLSDTATEGVFTWVTGETYAYSNWADLQPDDAVPGEDCTELNHEGFAAGAWNDTSCGALDLAGYICEAGFCGDGLVTGSETCDDGDTSSGDGCSATCTVESGYSCLSQPSSCATTCGDGLKAGAETCDDGDTSSGDGCSATCAVEDGWSCDNEAPNVCTEDPVSSASSSSSVASSASSSSSVASSASSSVASSAAPSSASSSVASSAEPSSASSTANSVTISSSATQRGGGGRGASRDEIRSPANGHTTEVFSEQSSIRPVTHPAALPSQSPTGSIVVPLPSGRQPVVIRDVKSTDAAASDVRQLFKEGIMTGYADLSGRPLGVFGVSDALTYAQTAKIAVKVGKVQSVGTDASPLHGAAANEWSEPYLRAAKREGWTAFERSVDTNAHPTKNAVMQTLLDAADIPYDRTNAKGALHKAAQIGLTSAVDKRALTRREVATIIVKILNHKKKEE